MRRAKKTIAEMTPGEREQVLRTLAKRLQSSSSIAKHESDPIWRPLQEFAERLLRDVDDIAIDDAESAAKVVLEAIKLLCKFEMNQPHTHTVH